MRSHSYASQACSPASVGAAIRLLVVVALAAAPLALVPTPAHGQGFMDRLKQKAQDRLNNAEDSLTDAALDAATGAVTCSASNTACIKKVFKAGKTVKLVDAKGKPVSPDDSAKAVARAGGVPANVTATAASAAPASAPTASADAPQPADATPEPAAFINYDFVPGDKVLFSEDFSADKVGDLPSRVQVLSGNFEIADYKGRRMLRSSSGGRVMIPLPSQLPDKFTVEIELIHSWGWNTEVHFVDADHSDGMDFAEFGGSGGVGQFQSAAAEDESGKLYTARIMGDGGHVKVYEDGKRVANVPAAKLGRANAIWIDGPGSDDEPFYLASVRVAASDKSLFDALSASGRVSTHGILFATNSDAIQPESAPTLQEIGQMLQQHADLKLTIEGHTDNVGAAAANQSLSDRRAAAVRQYLIGHYQIDGSRLASKGYGATKPAASNATPEGRQQNRRVELVKN